MIPDNIYIIRINIMPFYCVSNLLHIRLSIGRYIQYVVYNMKISDVYMYCSELSSVFLAHRYKGLFICDLCILAACNPEEQWASVNR